MSWRSTIQANKFKLIDFYSDGPLNFMSNKNTFLYSLLHIFNRSSERNFYFKAHKTFLLGSIPLPPSRQYTVGTSNAPMDQISTKTPNLKCRFIEFIDWRYSQSCWYLQPLLWTSAPLTFSLVLLPPLLLFPLWIIKGVHVFIQCVTGGGEIGGLRQKNTCRQVPLLIILKKSRYRVWCLYSYLVHEYPPPPPPPSPTTIRWIMGNKWANLRLLISQATSSECTTRY